jgi:formylglycine-generating enzyme required for sulfatase activity
MFPLPLSLRGRGGFRRGVTTVPTPPIASPPERRVALVIGNAAYQYTAPLTNPLNDAKDMARVLKDLQFQVILQTNATLDTMADAVFTFGEQLKGGGVGLFYYAGHGLQVKGENYLIPVDANIRREDDIKRKTINAGDILDKMDEAKSHLNLVFLDACRNNPFPRSVRAVSRGLASMSAPTGTLLVFATNPDNTAEDGTGRNGTYTKHLLQYITQPDLEVGMLLRRVRTAVREETGGKQVPWETGSIEGEFYFNGVSGAPPAEAQLATIVGNDGAEMVLVPAGEFIMGSAGDELDHLKASRESFGDEIPRHRVYLDAFYIDKFEVTNARFQRFVQATGYRTLAERAGDDATWRAPRDSGSNITGLEQHPVVQVSQEDAKAYCTWAGKRLPAEAEWEKAARGTDGRTYPWGNQFDSRQGNFEGKNKGTVPVGSYEGGKSPYGAHDMAGNVLEWVADWYDVNYYRNSLARNPQGPASGDRAVLRGGGWNNGALNVRAPSRNRNAPANRAGGIGFRCAKTL